MDGLERPQWQPLLPGLWLRLGDWWLTTLENVTLDDSRHLVLL
jgi:hypothetical protein